MTIVEEILLRQWFIWDFSLRHFTSLRGKSQMSV